MAKPRFTTKILQGKQRRCDKCTRTYQRRNIEERWFFDPEIKLWVKRKVKLCIKCSVPERTENAKTTFDRPFWDSKDREDSTNISSHLTLKLKGA